jgi:hypothetical protein
MTLRKGSRPHALAGNVFFVSMLIMSAAGTYIAMLIIPNMGNVMGGSMAFYLTASAWLTVWRRPNESGISEVGVALLGLSTAVAGFSLGIRAAHSARGLLDTYPPALYYVFASIALLGTVLDVRMIARGGLAGAARITRHLWRMCLAMLIATSSFFLGQAKLFPVTVRKSGLLFAPVLLVIAALLYWLIRIRVLPLLRRALTPRPAQSLPYR